MEGLWEGLWVCCVKSAAVMPGCGSIYYMCVAFTRRRDSAGAFVRLMGVIANFPRFVCQARFCGDEWYIQVSSFTLCQMRLCA